jgi:hypothetical protein
VIHRWVEDGGQYDFTTKSQFAANNVMMTGSPDRVHLVCATKVRSSSRISGEPCRSAAECESARTGRDPDR